MVTLEQVEKLRQYGNVTYDQAKKALEEAEGDILEAIIILENQNLIEKPVNGGYHNTKNEEENHKENFQEKEFQNGNKGNNKHGASFSELAGRFFKWFSKIIKRGNMNHFEVTKDKENVITIPATVLVLLLLFMFWIITPLMVVGLFFGYRYTFTGPDLGKDNVNRAMDSVAEAAENFKKEMKSDNNHGENSNN